MLRSVRELQTYKAATAEGTSLGRIKDVYFDDESWKITHLLISAGAEHRPQKQVLAPRDQISEVSAEEGFVQLRLSPAEIEALPLPSSVMPVCKQYAALSLASPGAGLFENRVAASSPKLRTAKAVTGYSINAAGEFSGRLKDLIFDSKSWEIRYLAIVHVIEGKKVVFHVLPQAVERFTWSTQRVVLRDLLPVRLDARHNDEGISAAA